MKPTPFQLEVQSYAGYRADERPLRFRIKAGRSTARTVVRVLDRWYGPDSQSFKVLADDGDHYILHHDERHDLWTLDAFSQDTPR